MIRVAEKNVYGDSLARENSIVPELLEAFDLLRGQLESRGIQARPFPQWENQRPDLGVFFDCPKLDDPDLRRCQSLKIPILLVVSENMHLQPHPTYAEIKALADRVLTYWETEVDHQKVFWLPYGLDFEAGRNFRKSLPMGNRPYLLGMINSWKKSEMPGDLYGRRNRLAIQAGILLQERMFLAGSGWDSHLVYAGKVQRSLAKRFPGLARMLWRWPNPAYHGRLPLGDRKLTALAQCEFALVPENCSSLPGYITEKIFNALFAGCIPVYQGHPDSNRWLPPQMFVPMDHFASGAALVNFLQHMTPDKKAEFRQAGKKFLESPPAIRFDARTWVASIEEQILALLPPEKKATGFAVGTSA